MNKSIEHQATAAYKQWKGLIEVVKTYQNAGTTASTQPTAEALTTWAKAHEQATSPIKNLVADDEHLPDFLFD